MVAKINPTRLASLDSTLDLNPSNSVRTLGTIFKFHISRNRKRDNSRLNLFVAPIYQVNQTAKSIRFLCIISFIENYVTESLCLRRIHQYHAHKVPIARFAKERLCVRCHTEECRRVCTMAETMVKERLNSKHPQHSSSPFISSTQFFITAQTQV